MLQSSVISAFGKISAKYTSSPLPRVGFCSAAVTSHFSFLVRPDDEPPQITCPDSDMKPADPGSDQLVFTYSLPSAWDNDGQKPEVSCSPVSGSFLPLGLNTITCTAVDKAGNKRPCSFTIRVKGRQKLQECPGCFLINICSCLGCCGRPYLYLFSFFPSACC